MSLLDYNSLSIHTNLAIIRSNILEDGKPWTRVGEETEIDSYLRTFHYEGDVTAPARVTTTERKGGGHFIKRTQTTNTKREGVSRGVSSRSVTASSSKEDYSGIESGVTLTFS